MNGANGMSDIEGKAAKGSSERVWATSEFQLCEGGFESSTMEIAGADDMDGKPGG